MKYVLIQYICNSFFNKYASIYKTLHCSCLCLVHLIRCCEHKWYSCHGMTQLVVNIYLNSVSWKV